MSELKPCPFCGSEVELLNSNYFDYVVIRCPKCGAKSADGRLPQYITDLWQNRPIEDELRKRIAELEAERRWIPVSERLPEGGGGGMKKKDDYDYEYKFTFDISGETERIVRQLSNRIDEAVLHSMNDITFSSLLHSIEEEAHKRGILAHTERRWIPVGERLPDAYEKVIALAKDCMNVDWVLPKELREVGKGAFARLYNVTHWMSLPTPPEAQYGIR